MEYQISAYAAPADMASKRKVTESGWILFCRADTGYNGAVINHGIIHADYMCAIMHNTLNAWIFGLADKKAPEASRMNGKKVYYALTEHEFVPGKTMYVRGEQGEEPAGRFFRRKRLGNRTSGWILADGYSGLFFWLGQSFIGESHGMGGCP
ncbi:MAG: hypothetical protein V8S95_06155 [Odoribacter sp.]